MDHPHYSRLAAPYLGSENSNEVGFLATLDIQTEHIQVRKNEPFPAALASKRALENFARALLGRHDATWDMIARIDPTAARTPS
jgi:hypothetical protein